MPTSRGRPGGASAKIAIRMLTGMWFRSTDVDCKDVVLADITGGIETTVKKKVARFQKAIHAMQVDHDTRPEEGKRNTVHGVIAAPACPNIGSTSSVVPKELFLTHHTEPSSIKAVRGRDARAICLAGWISSFGT